MIRIDELISIIIPLYNSARTITPVTEEIFECLDGKYQFELILVNDNSPDNVMTVAQALADRDKRIKVIDLSKNSGQTNAMLAGYTYARGKYLISMDDDFQHPAAAIIDLLDELIGKDMDVVFAKYSEQKENAFRRFGSFMNCKMAELMAGKPKNIRSNSYFAFRSFVKDSFLKYANSNPYIFGIIYASTDRISNVEVQHRSRVEGKSNFTLKKLIALWANGFFNFSIKPLRIATFLGFTIAIVSAIVGLFMIINRLLYPNVGVSGWTSIIVLVIFFSGIQLICTGILGEYLGRLYISHSKLPTYCVRNTINISTEEEAEK